MERIQIFPIRVNEIIALTLSDQRPIYCLFSNFSSDFEFGCGYVGRCSRRCCANSEATRRASSMPSAWAFPLQAMSKAVP